MSKGQKTIESSETNAEEAVVAAITLAMRSFVDIQTLMSTPTFQQRLLTAANIHVVNLMLASIKLPPRPYGE